MIPTLASSSHPSACSRSDSPAGTAGGRFHSHGRSYLLPSIGTLSPSGEKLYRRFSMIVAVCFMILAVHSLRMRQAVFLEEHLSFVQLVFIEGFALGAGRLSWRLLGRVD